MVFLFQMATRFWECLVLEGFINEFGLRWFSRMPGCVSWELKCEVTGFFFRGGC